MASSSATTPPGPPRVFVHIGAPKTGTTYLQGVLWRNRERLAEDGVLYPYETQHQHFTAMLDVLERAWGAHPAGYWRGTWDAVATRARNWAGHTVVLGNEILGGATEAQTRRLVASLQPAEVHVIFTARDLARQLVSDWQEHLKHRHTVSLEDFVDDLVEHGVDATPPFGEMFWGLHDAAHVLRSWGGAVPAERIHLVTLPPPGAPGDKLWRRFCAVTGLDPARYDLDVKPANPSLGRAEAEVLRRINMRVQSMQPPAYDALVRMRLAGTALAGGSGRIVLPEGRLPWVQERSRELVDALAGSGYDVVGDLEELIPRTQDHEGYVRGDAIPADDLLPVAVRTSAALLRIGGQQRTRIRRYRRQLGELPDAPASGPRRPRRHPWTVLVALRRRAARVRRALRGSLRPGRRAR